MRIVSGRISVRPGTRQAFLTALLAAVVQARSARGCRDFVVAADPLEPDRVTVYEEWESEEALVTFRGREALPRIVSLGRAHKGEADRVHTIALAGRLRAIVEDMPEMAAAATELVASFRECRSCLQSPWCRATGAYESSAVRKMPATPGQSVRRE